MKPPVEQLPPELSTLTVYLTDPKTSEHSSESSVHHNMPAPALSDDIPDGGYGWVVVSACSLITYVFAPRSEPYFTILFHSRAFYVGGFNSWGVLQAGLSKDQVGQNFTLAFVGSRAVSWVAIGAVPNSWVVHRLGTQRAAILGCFCSDLV
jgi:hypothetical protein